MGLFKLDAQESTTEVKRSRTSRHSNKVVSIATTYSRLAVKLGDRVYPIDECSQNLDITNRVYVKKNNEVLLANVKDSEIQRNVYSVFRRDLKVKGYVNKKDIIHTFVVTHICYDKLGKKYTKLKLK